MDEALKRLKSRLRFIFCDDWINDKFVFIFGYWRNKQKNLYYKTYNDAENNINGFEIDWSKL